MKVLKNEELAVTGVNILLSTQEQVVLKDLLEAFRLPLERVALKSFKSDVRVDVQALTNLVTFMDKLTVDTPSMRDCYNDLFDIKEEEVESVGKIPMS